MTKGAVASMAHVQLGAPKEEDLVEGSAEWRLHEPATVSDKPDAGTPDEWIPRDPRILRLTGRHPLNCEPPMDVLMETGFIQPPSIHYVRNHGAVPKLHWDSHRINISGLVGKEMSISMDELLALPSVTLPVTMVCAGNRRREQNMVKKSIGFNWGPCAVSTSYWTGVRVADLLAVAGVSSVADTKAKHICFAGPKGELPKGTDGSYGTSILLSYAMDPANDVLIAYKQNGRWLTPDHGFPVRTIIPGHIGGRTIKWLCDIELTEEESDNYYHFNDNRVLPPHVDAELATKEAWWYKPDFIINELNINSAVARPWHDEVVPLGANTTYNVQGYAYTGGGRKVIRVEVSLDGGDTWVQADIKRFNEPTDAGKHWCWVHWDLDVNTAQFLAAPTRELLVRAWDSSQNGQPDKLTWNVMGMMNNCYFRIKIHPYVDAQGAMHLRFQHPAPVPQPTALDNPGWREEEMLAKQGQAPAAPVAAPVAKAEVKQDSGVRLITMEEVEQHADEDSAWFVHEGKVYDATAFLDEHPGGADSILISSGMDATDEFNSIHSAKAKGMLQKYYIGELADSATAAAAAPVPPPTPARSDNTASASSSSLSSSSSDDGRVNVNGIAANGVPNAVVGDAAASKGLLASDAAAAGGVAASHDAPVALDPRKKIAFVLAEKHELSHNVRRFRFALQTPQHRFGLPVGKHVFLYATINGETVMRAYTPTTADEVLGHFDLVIKVYRANEHPKFPEGGKMSQHLDSLTIGDTMDVKGPVGHMEYVGRGQYKLNRKQFSTKAISMIAGGTGITPCWQVIRSSLADPEDTTQLALVYANQSEDDILLRTELEALAAQHPDRFKLWYTLDRAPEGWKYSTGFINEEMLREHLLPAGDNAIVAMCGPGPMVTYACLPNLKKLGYADDAMIQF